MRSCERSLHDTQKVVAGPEPAVILHRELGDLPGDVGQGNVLAGTDHHRNLVVVDVAELGAHHRRHDVAKRCGIDPDSEERDPRGDRNAANQDHPSSREMGQLQWVSPCSRPS